jgi:hypothetical protein
VVESETELNSTPLTTADTSTTINEVAVARSRGGVMHTMLVTPLRVAGMVAALKRQRSEALEAILAEDVIVTRVPP